MPPKRKAGAAALPGGAKRSRQSTPATPAATVDSSDEYSESSDSENDGKDGHGGKINMNKATSKLFKIRGEKNPQGTTSEIGRYFSGGTNDFSFLRLKPDHESRPLWVEPKTDPNDVSKGGTIVLESFSPLAQYASDFLTTIAEPMSRPTYLHEYKITLHSMYAAVSAGLKPDDIIAALDRLSKVAVPMSVKDFILSGTENYGKAKLVLRENRYYVESNLPHVIRQLLADPIIGPKRIIREGEGEADGIIKRKAPKKGGIIIPGTKEAAGARQIDAQPAAQEGAGEGQGAEGTAEDIFASVTGLGDNEDAEDAEDTVISFEIPGDAIQDIMKRSAEDLGLPLLEEYEFHNDHINARLDIDLRPQARIRPYQEKCLSKMFGNGRAKSGIIVLPCGAGKTLVGITAACTIKKSVIVLATSAMSVVQWRQEFIKWSDINPEQIAIFTSDSKEKFRGDAGIVVSTYSMVTNSRNRSHDSQQMMDFLTKREWGLLILDEAHVVPANIFRKVTQQIPVHSKLGLTATLLREDDKISELNFLIGPKLYEANWMELADQGHIAKVQCAEVWCPMTPEFYTQYLNEPNVRKKTAYYIMNPAKFQACQYLIKYHEERGDKIIVFSDNVYALEAYAKKIGRAYIYGGTSQQERLQILENFQKNPDLGTIFLSKIGDTSLDLPEATCLIQISSHYGSRRQEAQRLGRILRAKRRNDEGFNAFFYSLVSKDTMEMYYSSKRQAFLVDQGYSFKVITKLQGQEAMPSLAYTTKQERQELLAAVIMNNERAGDIELGDDFDGAKGLSYGGNKNRFKRSTGKLSEIAGGAGMAYIEYNKSRNKELKKGSQSAFFKKVNREKEKRRKEYASGKD